MRIVIGALIAASIVSAAPRAHACAGCRNPNMPITRLEAVHLRPGQVRAAAVVGATSLDVVHQAGCADPANCSEVPAQPVYLHDQRLLPAELRPIVEVGVTERWGLELHVPFRLTRTTIQYKTPAGVPYEPLDPGVHHRNETLAGIGDPWVLGRWNGLLAGTLLTARLGISLPLGRTEENPFALGAEGKRHQHIQFGTGTFDPVAGIDVSRAFGKVQGVAYAQAQMALYENEHGFRSGLRVLTGLQAGRRLWGGLSGALGGDILHEGAERWDERIQQDGNLGRTEVLVGASLVQSFGATSVGLTARFPVWRRIVTGDEPAGRLSSPVMLSLVASHTFGR
jgi:hypothetical protein